MLTGSTQSALLEQRQEQLRTEFGVTVEAMACDVGEPTAVRDLYAEVFKRHKRLDILVNNAGVLHDALLGMVSVASAARTFRVNVDGVLLNMQYASG